MSKRAALLVLSLALGFAGLYLVVGEELLRAETYRVRDFDAVLAALAVAAFAGKWLGPAVRVGLLCRAQGVWVTYRSALLVHLSAMFVAAFTPNNTGVGPATAAALYRVGVSLGRGFGVVVQVLILDLIFFALAVPAGIGYLIYSDTLRLPPGVGAAAFVTAALAVAGAIILTRYPRLVVRLILAVAKLRPMQRFASRLRKAARDYYHSGKAFLKLSAGYWVALVLATALGWLSSFALFWLLLQLYGVGAGLLATLATLTSLTLVSHFVPTPGASGFMEAAVGFSVGATAGGGLAAALLIWRVATFYSIFLLGPPAGWLLYLSSKETGQARTDQRK